MLEQRTALLRLLNDDDPTTLQLVKGQLAGAGLARLSGLRELLAEAGPAAAHHLREVIGAIEAREADTILAQLCAGFGEHGDLEEAAWRLAATFRPGEDFAVERALLDAWGAEVARRLRKASSEVDCLETLVEFLGHEVRLRGNEADYYNINNSLLPEVIDSRVGIPISLSLVYLLVARRAGLSLSGVGLPGHFLVRHQEHFFDPFHGGRRVGMDDCRALVERQQLLLAPQHLQPVTPRQMLARMLANLYACTEESDPPLAAKISGWIDALNQRPQQAI
ncbi:MAG: hypothetical protein QOE70_4407 [Chthoniobacter sp.]|jgi:regulator of sirC expression with transglutaminase-like and TPR domain|nr:hypothetical protein [Chthoniobacter sp.]